MNCANNHNHERGREGRQKARFIMYSYSERDRAIHPELETGERLCQDCAREWWQEGWGLSEEGHYSIAREEMRAMRRQYINDFCWMRRHDPQKLASLKLPAPIRDAVRKWERDHLGMTLSLYI